MINEIFLSLNKIDKKEKIEIDDISFSGIYYICLKIDNYSLIGEKSILVNSFVYWEELARSSISSGSFLIFTCVCGIADDGGWDFVEVKMNEQDGTISWNFEYDKKYYFKFNILQLKEEIAKLKKEIAKLDSGYNLEPVNVVFPES